MDNFYGMKEMYDVSLRLTKPLEIGNRKFDVNESILTFKTAEVAQLQENKKNVYARGGLYNNPLVDWEIDKEMSFAITNGVLSPLSWALLSNSKLNEPKVKSVSYQEELRTVEDENYCYVDLKYRPNALLCKIGAQPNPNFEPMPMGRREELMLKPLPPSKTKWVFCYDMDTGALIRDFRIYDKKIFFSKSFNRILVDYTFDYEDRIMVLEVGNRLLNGFLRLEGKMSVKDEKSGEVSTAILELPKIKISSSLSIRLGKNYDTSVVSDFYFTGFPEQERNGTTAKITFLDKELTGDYI